MKKHPSPFPAAGFLCLAAMMIFMFSSCSLFRKTTATLWTDRPEIAAYVEVFNAEQEKYKIEVAFRQNPADSILSAQSSPDIVFGTRLTSAKMNDRFSSLEPLFKKELLDPSIFYPELLEYGSAEEERVLLPVSFNLPVMLFRPENIPEEIDNFHITLDEIKTLAAEFTQESSSEMQKMGFVTYWEPEFLYAATALSGADYHETQGGHLAWDNGKLQTAVQNLSGWSDSMNGGLETEQLFIDRYLYNPGYKLIDNGRILFYFMGLQDFLTIPDDKRQSLDFRWVSSGESFLISEDILFAGIPRGAKSRSVAENFLTWFFKEETQKRLLEAARFKRIRTFGIAQGFSSLIWINEREIPSYYPDLLGHIPPASRMDFPEPLPIDWTEMKEEVLLPWLRETVSSKRERGSLDARLQTWLMQKSN